MSRLLVCAPDLPGNDWQWFVPGDPGVARGDLAQLAAARAALPALPPVLLLPAARVLTVAVTVPVRQQRQMQPAFPFLVEENLAGDIEQCHVVAGMRIDPQRLQLVAVERAFLASVLASLRSVGIDPPVVTSEALALSVPPQGATFLLDGENSLLATADGQTLAFAQADATTIAGMMVFGEGDRIEIRCGRHGDALAARAVENELLAASPTLQVAVDEVPVERLQLLADAIATRMPVNLRQGAFAAAGEASFSLGFDWRPLAWLAACWVVLALAYQVAVGISHARAAASVHAAQVALYRQVFPGAKNVPHPRAQMEGQLRGAGGGASFTALVAQTSETLAALAGKDAGRYAPRTISWDAQQGELHVDIVARGLEDIEQLRSALQQRGLAVDVGSGVSQAGGYKARLNIGMPATVAGGAR